MRQEHESKEMIKILYSLIDHSPIGMLLLNQQTEVIYTNDLMEDYFDYFKDSKSNQFGNLFGCEIVEHENELCGTQRQCSNCKIRNSMVNALQFKRPLKDVKVHKTFMKDNQPMNKWLNMTFIPIDDSGEKYLVVYVQDVTNHIKREIDMDFDELLYLEEIYQEKSHFHDAILNEIKENCGALNQAYLVLIELTDYKAIKDNFGMQWANDFCLDFMNYAYSIIEDKKHLCRYSENQFLFFMPCSEKDVRHYFDAFQNYTYRIFSNKNRILIRTIRITAAKEKTDKIDDELLYLSYFKCISRLESSDTEAWIELTV